MSSLHALVLRLKAVNETYKSSAVREAIERLQKQEWMIDEFIVGEDEDHPCRKAWETQDEIIKKQAAKLKKIEHTRIAMIKRVAELEDEGSPDQAWHELMEYIETRVN